mgnify:CR=1 FL=1
MAKFVRFGLATIVVAIAAFWVWALFFPPKESVARLDDREWASRADSICAVANQARNALADERRIDDVGPGALAERAELIDQATSIIDEMLDKISTPIPTGTEDSALVETWLGYYRQLMKDRRAYTEVLRNGDNPPFPEATIDGAPISEYINDFTVANEMKACSAPADLAV